MTNKQEPMIFKSSVIMDAETIEKLRQTIKKQIDEGIVLLPHYIDSISPYEIKADIFDKIKAEIHASAIFKPDYEWYVSEKRIMQIIDKYRQEE